MSAEAEERTKPVLTQLETMTRMQIAHNVEVHPDWETQGYPYYRAIWVECAELLDHFRVEVVEAAAR